MAESGPLLVDTGRGLSVMMGGKWLYSSRNPTAAPIQAALAVQVLPETCYFVASPCLAYGLAELIGRLPASSAVLCLEFNTDLLQIARKAMATLTPAGRCMLTTAAELVPSYRALEARLSTGRFRRVIEVRLSGGRSLDTSRYDRAISALDADISIRYRNRVAMVRMGRLWTKNVVANLGSMRWEDVSPLPLCDQPVLVCGAGPSLDASIPSIQRFRNELFVLACDTATGALVNAGILPDAIVCLEGQVYNVSDFLPLDGRKTRLIVDLSSHPSSYRAVTGPKTILMSEWTESAFLQRLRATGLPVLALPPLGSVGVLALRVASMMARALLVTGLDFSYPPGRTHCAHSPAALREKRAESRLYRMSASWASSFREGTSRIQGGSIIDPALSMYATLAAAELRGKNAWDLRGDHCSTLPIPALAHEQLESWLGDFHASSSVAHRTLYGQDQPKVPYGPIECQERTAAFLRAELVRTDTLSTALREGTDKETLGMLLAEADFLYAHFPDPERVTHLNEDALKRVAAEAVYWKGRLEMALANAENSSGI